MNRHLVWHSLDRRLIRAHGRSREGFHHFARTLGIGNPFVVELVRARRDAAVAFAGVDHSSIAAVHQLEEMIFGLSGPARVADQHLRKLGVLNSVVFLATLPERADTKTAERGGLR